MEKLTQEEISILKQIAQERLSRGDSPKKIPLRRDMTCTKSVRISTRMMELVTKEAKGETFSSLVERLLFKYLGSPEELVDR